MNNILYYPGDMVTRGPNGEAYYFENPLKLIGKALATALPYIPEVPPFEGFPKVPRLHRTITITEKLDGTNGFLHFLDDGRLLVGSKGRYVTPGKSTDNFGFAAWAESHREELLAILGPGKHFGEWYGHKIGRGYGLTTRRFALFNTSRWSRYSDNLSEGQSAITPEMCGGTLDVVEVLDEVDSFDSRRIQAMVDHLTIMGSRQVPGFRDPEGIIVYHSASRQIFKVTCDNDAMPKSLASPALRASAKAQKQLVAA